MLEKEDDKGMIEDQDNQGKIPMHIAAERGNLIAVQTLASMNSSLERKDHDKKGPIHLAAEHGHEDVIEYLVLENRSLIMSTDQLGYTPLHIACRENQAKAAAMLLKFGASMDQRTSTRATPQEVAIRRNRIECVEVLLEV